MNNDGATFKIYTDADAAYADVQAGSLDVMDTVPSADSKTFEFDSSVVPYNKAGSVIQTFTIPCYRPQDDRCVPYRLAAGLSVS